MLIITTNQRYLNIDYQHQSQLASHDHDIRFVRVTLETEDHVSAQVTTPRDSRHQVNDADHCSSLTSSYQSAGSALLQLTQVTLP